MEINLDRASYRLNHPSDRRSKAPEQSKTGVNGQALVQVMLT